MQGVTVSADKLFNREAVLLVKLTCLASPRFSVSLAFSLSRRSVLHDKARSCQSAREPLLLRESPLRKLSTSRCPSASKVAASGDNLSRSCELQQKSLRLHYAFEHSRAFLSPRGSENYPCTKLTEYSYSNSLRIAF